MENPRVLIEKMQPNKPWHAARHHFKISHQHQPNGRVHAFERPANTKPAIAKIGFTLLCPCQALLNVLIGRRD